MMAKDTAEKEKKNSAIRIILTLVGKLVFFGLLTVALTTFFSYLLIYILEATGSNQDFSIVSYYQSIIEAAGIWTPIFLGLYFAVIVVISLLLETFRNSAHRKITLPTEIIVNFGIGAAVLVLSTFLATAVVFLFSQSYLTKEIEEVQGELDTEMLQTDPDQIIAYLEDPDSCPTVATYSQQVKEEIVLDSVREDESLGTYYTDVYLKDVFYWFDYRIDLSAFPQFMYEDALYVISVDAEAIEEISPALAQKLVQCQFPEEGLNGGAELDVLDKKEYTKLEEQRYDDILAEYDKFIAEIENDIKEINEGIEESQRYYNMYGSPIWLDIKNDYEELLVVYEGYLSELKTDRARIEEDKGNIGAELGYFLPPLSISIVVDDGFNEHPDEYVGTLVHEYLHYASDSSTTSLDLIFEEGLTQMYTNDILSDQLDIPQGYSYLVPVQFLEELLEDESDEEVQRIYFEKDHDGLVQMLDRSYGEGFYERHEVTFKRIRYMELDEQVDAVNEILDEVGKTPVTGRLETETEEVVW